MRQGRSGLPLQSLPIHSCLVRSLDSGYDSLCLIDASAYLGWIQFGSLHVCGPKLCYSASMSQDAWS